MTKTEIDAFLSVVQCGSISAAAEQSYVTQPALSRRIRNLEEELGYTLFVRDKGIRGITLTEQGEAFLSVARKWDTVYREAMEIRNLQRKPVLHLAAIGSLGLGMDILPEILNEIAAKDTPYRLDYHSCHSYEGYSRIAGGFSELAFIDYLTVPDSRAAGQVISLPVYSAPFVLAGGPDWKGYGPAHPSQLESSQEIRLPWNVDFDRWHDRWFGQDVQPKAQLDFSGVLPKLLRDGLFSIVPRTVGKNILAVNPQTVLLPLLEGPPDEVIHCLTTAENLKMPQVRHFMRLLQSHLAARGDLRCLLKESDYI